MSTKKGGKELYHAVAVAAVAVSVGVSVSGAVAVAVGVAVSKYPSCSSREFLQRFEAEH